MAGPISSRSNARFIPHMGNRVPFGIVMTASTYLREDNIKSNDRIIKNIYIYVSIYKGVREEK